MDVGTFFDSQAEAYHANQGPMTPFHVLTARRIEAGIRGRVLAVGGLWDHADLDHRDDLELTVVDVSSGMLQPWAQRGLATRIGDARALPVPDHSVDHVIYGLVLHHITEGGFRAARQQLERVFDELIRVLAPGGTVWISDFAVRSPVYLLEGLASPLTKRLLGSAGIPLVVMHRARTYTSALEARGMRVIEVVHPLPEGTSNLDLLTPVIGLPWLRIPRGLYPLKPVLIVARR